MSARGREACEQSLPATAIACIKTLRAKKACSDQHLQQIVGPESRHPLLGWRCNQSFKRPRSILRPYSPLISSGQHRSCQLRPLRRARRRRHIDEPRSASCAPKVSAKRTLHVSRTRNRSSQQMPRRPQARPQASDGHSETPPA